VIPDDLVPVDCPWEIVLGLDPGTRCAGYGSIVLAPEGPRLVACGVFRTPAGMSVPERLGKIQGELEQLLGALRPSAVAIESAFTGANVRSALRLGEARGMMMATVARRAIAVHEYSPAQAKKAVLGNGAASKQQVASMVATLLDCDPVAAPADATDALALALTHVQHMRVAATRARALARPRSNGAAG